MNPITVWCPTCGGRGTIATFTMVGHHYDGRDHTTREVALKVCPLCDGSCTITATPFTSLDDPDNIAPAVRATQHPTQYPPYP